ncbi:MAG: AraC family transcriptional regulator [Bacteroidales bacterium]|nr:AraC family transcriptional regulator [Bacteroidales bacterium]
MTSTFHIKNMVCPRCIEAVQEIFSSQKANIILIELGKVEIENELTEKQLKDIQIMLDNKGFELIKDKNQKVIDQIKSLIIQVIHHTDKSLDNFSFTEYLAKELNIEYKQLSTLFSLNEGFTIEKFIILQKVEKVKELISYNELTFSEIAYKLGYSSVHYLSNQFKKITGFTPSQFANLELKKRKALDNIK